MNSYQQISPGLQRPDLWRIYTAGLSALQLRWVGLTSHSTHYMRSFQRRSSQPISWLVQDTQHS